MLDKEDLQAIAQLMDVKLESALKPINDRLDSMEGRLDSMGGRLDSMGGRLDSMGGHLDSIDERLSSLEEDSQVTRSAVNTLLAWAEEAQVQVKIPLFKKAE